MGQSRSWVNSGPWQVNKQTRKSEKRELYANTSKYEAIHISPINVLSNKGPANKNLINLTIISLYLLGYLTLSITRST